MGTVTSIIRFYCDKRPMIPHFNCEPGRQGRNGVSKPTPRHPTNTETMFELLTFLICGTETPAKPTSFPPSFRTALAPTTNINSTTSSSGSSSSSSNNQGGFGLAPNGSDSIVYGGPECGGIRAIGSVRRSTGYYIGSPTTPSSHGDTSPTPSPRHIGGRDSLGNDTGTTGQASGNAGSSRSDTYMAISLTNNVDSRTLATIQSTSTPVQSSPILCPTYARPATAYPAFLFSRKASSHSPFHFTSTYDSASGRHILLSLPSSPSSSSLPPSSGLPPLVRQSSAEYEGILGADHLTSTASAGRQRVSSRAVGGSGEDDPDLAMALAISASMQQNTSNGSSGSAGGSSGSGGTVNESHPKGSAPTREMLLQSARHALPPHFDPEEPWAGRDAPVLRARADLLSVLKDLRPNLLFDARQLDESDGASGYADAPPSVTLRPLNLRPGEGKTEESRGVYDAVRRCWVVGDHDLAMLRESVENEIVLATKREDARMRGQGSHETSPSLDSDQVILPNDDPTSSSSSSNTGSSGSNSGLEKDEPTLYTLLSRAKLDIEVNTSRSEPFLAYACKDIMAVEVISKSLRRILMHLCCDDAYISTSVRSINWYYINAKVH